MWFEKKKPEVHVPTPEELAEQARQRLEAQVMKTIEEQTAFQVTTVDGLFWICPYTGALVPSPFGYQETARNWLMDKQPWKGGAKPRPLQALQQARWLHWLNQHLELEPRLRLLGPDQRWLNPFTGAWVRLARVHAEIAPGEPLKDVAAVLAQTPEAQAGKPMLSRERLETILAEREKAVSSGADGAGNLPISSHATTRVSGSREEASRHSDRLPTPAANAGDDLSRANSILQKMLAPMPVVPGYGLIVHYEPHSEVGGDVYECGPLIDGRQLLLLGDVAGHGVQGAMVVVAALKSLRFILREERDLVRILARLNDDLRGDLLAGQFMTVCAMALDPVARSLECVLAGHHQPVLASLERSSPLLRFGHKGPALGLMPGERIAPLLRPVRIELQPGDQVLAWTDGLTEVMDPKQVEYGTWRMLGSLLAHLEEPYDELVAGLVAGARGWTRGEALDDDLTVLCLAVERELTIGSEDAL